MLETLASLEQLIPIPRPIRAMSAETRIYRMRFVQIRLFMTIFLIRLSCNKIAMNYDLQCSVLGLFIVCRTILLTHGFAKGTGKYQKV